MTVSRSTNAKHIKEQPTAKLEDVHVMCEGWEEAEATHDLRTVKGSAMMVLHQSGLEHSGTRTAKSRAFDPTQDEKNPKNHQS